MAVCGSKVQAREGIEDSVDAFVSDMLIAGLYLNDEEKCRLIAEKSNETWEWSVEMGCTWDKDENGEPWLYPYGGHSILCTICQGVGGGSNVTGPLSEKLGEMGVNVETERMLVQLVQNDEGRVIGAVVRDGASGNDVESGKPVAIHATKGVVLATGGFGRDLEFRLAQDPRLDETVDCTNQEGATAESLKAAVRAGAMAVHTDWIQLLPFMSPDEQGYGRGGLLHRRPSQLRSDPLPRHRPPRGERADRPQALCRCHPGDGASPACRSPARRPCTARVWKTP